MKILPLFALFSHLRIWPFLNCLWPIFYVLFLGTWQPWILCTQYSPIGKKDIWWTFCTIQSALVIRGRYVPTKTTNTEFVCKKSNNIEKWLDRFQFWKFCKKSIISTHKAVFSLKNKIYFDVTYKTCCCSNEKPMWILIKSGYCVSTIV